ncbi:hypothetical protein GCM10009641_52840 [Mycobacterium cookii]|uniref:Uncharacterized protein n=1 Tax=Mycobacterium cookii TaxID=1775 RepID=A0A7I7KVL3_9MYCO|nr:hypothetical protein MCOO_15330 [Mycobacterium cookii]
MGLGALVARAAQGTPATPAADTAVMADTAPEGMSPAAPVVMADMGPASRAAPGMSPASRAGQVNRMVPADRADRVSQVHMNPAADPLAQVLKPGRALADLTPTVPDRAHRDPTRPADPRSAATPAAAVLRSAATPAERTARAGLPRPAVAIRRAESGQRFVTPSTA